MMIWPYFVCAFKKEVSTNCTTFNILIIYEVYVYVYLFINILKKEN